MPELTLHFESADGTDLKAVASHLEQKISAVSGVEAAEAQPQVLRFAGLPEILTIITLGTAAVTSSIAFLKAVKGLLQAYQDVAKQFPGLHLPTLEVGLRKVPIDKLTEKDAAEVLAAQ
jgi:hypothetical protein